MKSKITIFLACLIIYFSYEIISSQETNITKNIVKPISISSLLNIIKSDKIILEKAIESKKYFSVNSKDIIKIYNDIELAEYSLSELKNKISDSQLLSQISEGITLAGKAKINLARLNDIIKSKSQTRIYSGLIALESNIYEMKIYLKGLNSKLTGKFSI